MKEPTKGDLRVWWSCNFGSDPFTFPVASLETAAAMLNMLAKYDYYVHETVYLNPEFNNAGGLQVFDGVSWDEWEDEYGNDFNTWALARKKERLSDCS